MVLVIFTNDLCTLCYITLDCIKLSLLIVFKFMFISIFEASHVYICEYCTPQLFVVRLSLFYCVDLNWRESMLIYYYHVACLRDFAVLVEFCVSKTMFTLREGKFNCVYNMNTQ